MNELEQFFSDLEDQLNKAVDSLPEDAELAKAKKTPEEYEEKAAKPAGMKQEDWDKLSPEEQAKYGEAKAKKKPEEYYEETKKALLSIVKALDLTIVKGKEDEASPFARYIYDIKQDSDTLREVCTKMLERIENLEKHTAVRKSIEGDEGGDGGSKYLFDGTVRTLLNKGKVSLR